MKIREGEDQSITLREREGGRECNVCVSEREKLSEGEAQSLMVSERKRERGER